MNSELLASLPASIIQNGWAITPPVIDSRALATLTDALAPALAAAASHGGVRNVLDSEVVRQVAASGPLRDVASAVLGTNAGAVRAILFDKTPQANWKVVWHQDLTIAVEAEASVEGYGPWSVKDGVIHVQPPVPVLEEMLAVRLHLDPCASDNGPVRVLSGSHSHGRLSPDAIDAWRQRVPDTECLVALAGLLVFRPLLLHASSPARSPGHRRVLHIEYRPPILPGGLRWHTWVPARLAA